MDNNAPTSDDKTDSGSVQDSFGKPDTEYYFNIVVIKVENTIFRVPKNGLDVPETILGDMFSVPVTGSDTEGSSDRNPIVLPVSEEYFRGFLRAMYAINGRQMTETDWLGALDLSTMWRFKEIRERAIRALDDWIQKKNAKEAVLLAKKYRIAHWLTDAYIRVLQQETLRTTELGASPFSLDWETIARLFSAKEATREDGSSEPECANCGRFRHGRKSCNCYKFQARTTTENLKIAIRSEFKEEFTRINEEYRPETSNKSLRPRASPGFSDLFSAQSFVFSPQSCTPSPPIWNGTPTSSFMGE